MNTHRTASRSADIEAITEIVNGQYGSWDAQDADMLIDRFDRDYPSGTYLPGEELKHLSIDAALAYVSRFTTLFKVLEHKSGGAAGLRSDCHVGGGGIACTRLHRHPSG